MDRRGPLIFDLHDDFVAYRGGYTSEPGYRSLDAPTVNSQGGEQSPTSPHARTHNTKKELNQYMRNNYQLFDFN
jgi:hypothetical protein